jgi:SOS response associated peptidase (SRAP)
MRLDLPKLHSNGCPARGLHHISVMCGRYGSFLPAEAIAKLFGTVNPLPNLAPTMDAPVVRLVEGARHLDALKWGLVPSFTKDMKKARKPINARDDNVAKSGMFWEAFAKRRCLVPAPVYYEWRDDPDGKTPFAVARVDGEPVVFGGIWETWRSPDGERLQTFATEFRNACRSSSSARNGRYGLARRKATRRSYYAPPLRTRSGSGPSTKRSGKFGMTGPS